MPTPHLHTGRVARGKALVALSLVLLCGACVSFSKGGLFPEARDQVFVEYFDNGTFFRNVEFDLSEHVVAEILKRPGLKLTSKEQAEVLITGRVVSVQQRVLSEDEARKLTSASTTITVVVEILDAMTGALIKRTQLSQRGEYVPKLLEDIDDAREMAFRFLARDIVRELETEF
ncbi:MAG: hypothetical protein DHS20C15_14810 [Planctomycetota bacterium]|nr:MAG: hypothetical protein DHS20C15_14810 [Planctomycetota bacterium]